MGARPSRDGRPSRSPTDDRVRAHPDPAAPSGRRRRASRPGTRPSARVVSCSRWCCSASASSSAGSPCWWAAARTSWRRGWGSRSSSSWWGSSSWPGARASRRGASRCSWACSCAPTPSTAQLSADWPWKHWLSYGALDLQLDVALWFGVAVLALAARVPRPRQGPRRGRRLPRSPGGGPHARRGGRHAAAPQRGAARPDVDARHRGPRRLGAARWPVARPECGAPPRRSRSSGPASRRPSTSRGSRPPRAGSMAQQYFRRALHSWDALVTSADASPHVREGVLKDALGRIVPFWCMAAALPRALLATLFPRPTRISRLLGATAFGLLLLRWIVPAVSILYFQREFLGVNGPAIVSKAMGMRSPGPGSRRGSCSPRPSAWRSKAGEGPAGLSGARGRRRGPRGAIRESRTRSRSACCSWSMYAAYNPLSGTVAMSWPWDLTWTAVLEPSDRGRGARRGQPRRRRRRPAPAAGPPPCRHRARGPPRGHGRAGGPRSPGVPLRRPTARPADPARARRGRCVGGPGRRRRALGQVAPVGGRPVPPRPSPLPPPRPLADGPRVVTRIGARSAAS